MDAKADRKLLDLAAKAAGITADASVLFGGGCNSWNPLSDDGDALRLAVKLKILDLHEIGIAPVNVWCDEDPYAATRRAIVRAAAEIGATHPDRESTE